MQYAIAFLEGIITFISPCLLPMLPIYISYFAGGGERSSGKTLRGALGFVAGFTVIFMLMGALAGTVGSFLKTHQTAVNIISGAIVIFFGLSYLGVFKLNIFKGAGRRAPASSGFFPSMLFGMIFSVGWTPCVGAFLGSALILASQQGHVLEGVIMLLAYSLGLGIPFERRHHVIGIEDSSAGVVSILLAGVAPIGLTDGNIIRAGLDPLCTHMVDTLPDVLNLI